MTPAPGAPGARGAMKKTEAMIDWSVSGSTTLREQTVGVLREALLSGIFRPGEKLVERTLAEHTGVSRTSIREALGQLEAEGLVRRVPGRGIYVTQLSEAEALDIYEARAILESALARLFAGRAAAEDIAALTDAVREAETTCKPELARLHAEKLDRVFEIITQGAGNDVASQMVSILRSRVTYLRTITSRLATAARREESMTLLRQLCDVLASRDAEQAERLMRAYVERSAQFAVSVLQGLDRESQAEGMEGR